jgi:hypothetical protein
VLEAQRQKLAYIAARLNGQPVSWIYAHHIGEHTQMSGSDGEFFDYRRGERFSTTHDHATGARWTIAVNGGDFAGYNYGNGHHFTGTIADGSVRLFDHGTEKWYDYGAQG